MNTRVDLPPLDLDLDLEALERAVALTPRERLHRMWQAASVWLRRHWLDLGLVATLLVLAFDVQARGMYISPARFDDEGSYTAYAWAVENLHRLAHYTYWYAHPPLGQLQMALYNVLTGSFDRLGYAVATGREFTLLCKLVSVVLMFGLARRLGFRRETSALAVLMFSLSPLAVYFQRTALLDNIVTPWLLAAFFLAASPRRSIGAAAGSAACFAIAVLTKETALLFMPALLLLFIQRADRRNRKFTIVVYMMVMSLLGLLYPLYALIKNELWAGPGHVSLEWAIEWQLLKRTGSGSIFDPTSTAHSVVTTWLSLDRWSCVACLIAVVPGLLARRTRAVALAFAVQLTNLLRDGYLPYPFVIAMIPFAVLTFAGVVDVLWQWSDGAMRLARRWGGAWSERAPTASASPDAVLDTGEYVPRRAVRPPRWRQRWTGALPRPRFHTSITRAGAAVAAVAAVVVLATQVAGPWWYGLQDLRTNDRDAGKAAALSWVERNTSSDDTLVVDDAYWVDLVRHGHPPNKVIWFTKLDVDKDVALPLAQPWRAIDYILLDRQDTLSLHLNSSLAPSKDTRNQFPTIAKAIEHGQVVAKFGTAGDEAFVWHVSVPPATPQHSTGPTGGR